MFKVAQILPHLLWLPYSNSYLCHHTETCITSGSGTLIVPQQAEVVASFMKPYYKWPILPGCLLFAKRQLVEDFPWYHRGRSQCDPEQWSGPVGAPPSEGALQTKKIHIQTSSVELVSMRQLLRGISAFLNAPTLETFESIRNFQSIRIFLCRGNKVTRTFFTKHHSTHWINIIHCWEC